MNDVREKFETGVRVMRAFEKEIAFHSKYFSDNEAELAMRVAHIVGEIGRGGQR